MNRTSAAALLMLLVACAACGGGSDRRTRPAITRPLDASKFREHACQLLPASEATRLGYPVEALDASDFREGAKPGDLARTYSCSRFPPESRTALDIGLYLDEDQLAQAYYFNERSTIGATGEPMLEAITIADQPAVVLGRSHKQPEQSESPCDVVVGLTDTQSVTVQASAREQDKPYDNTGGVSCERAIGVADAIVRNLVSQH